MSLRGEHSSSSLLLATSMTPSERRQPLHQLGLTKNNFLLNGIWTTPRSTTLQTSSLGQLHPFSSETTAPCWGNLQQQRVRNLSHKRWCNYLLKCDSTGSSEVISLQLIYQPSQHLILTEVHPAPFSKAEWVLSWLSCFYYYCPGQMRLVGNNRTDADSSAVGFSSWLGRGNTLGITQADMRSLKTGLSDPKGAKACNQSGVEG